MSFKLVRTCQNGGKSYSVLVGSNSQGPPSEAECRCSNAQGPSFSVLQVGLVVLRGGELVGRGVVWEAVGCGTRFDA